jgi:hypothetical protein
VHRRTELLNVLWKEDTLPGGHLSQCADRHIGRRELFEFCDLKEESTEGSSQGC